MFRALFLQCIVAIGVCSLIGAVPPAELKFYCDDTGTVDITLDGNDTDYKSIYARGVLSNGSIGECTVSGVDDKTASSSRFEIRQCVQDKDITVIIMKIPNQNQNTGRKTENGATKAPNSFIIGGEGMAVYSLTCSNVEKVADISSKRPVSYEVIKYATLPTSLSTPTTKASEFYAVVKMSIRRNDGRNLGNEKITIGDQLLVVISGPDGPTYFVKECKAFESNTSVEATSIDLIENGLPTTLSLMTSFEPVTQNTSPSQNNMSDICTATKQSCKMSVLHAFHFKDSPNVIIQCTIEVCNSGSISACQHKRRRRDTDLKSYVLLSTIKVHDQLKETEASHGNILRSSIVLSAMITAFWIIGKYT